MSWNPAVPPPPVAGAAVRNGLADGLGVADDDADGLGVADRDGDGLGVADRDADGLGVADGLAEGLTLVLGVVAPAVPPGGIGVVAEPVTAGENGVGVGEGEDVVQAETEAEASMVRVAQPTTVNRALSSLPMMVVRIFMGSPHASGRWRTRFAVPASEEKSRSARSLPAPAEGRSLEAPTAIRVNPWRAQACNGLFIAGILGYAIRAPWGRRREGRRHWGMQIGGA